MASRSTTHALPLLLLLLLLAAPLRATESAAAGEAAEAAGPGPGQTIQPTRQSIYSHLTAELQAALGAEQHVRDVFAGVAQGLRDTLRESVLPRLQALVDGVVERAEDAWVAADEAGRTLSVKPCVDSAEGDAQQVVKRALEKAEGCVKAVEEEGQLRVREAARLLNEIEDASKGLVTALEACIKEEAAKEAQAPDPAADLTAAPAPAPAAAPAPAPAAADAADTGVSVAEAPGQCPKAAGDDCPGEKTAAPGDGRQPKCKGCASGCKCKKTAEDESPKDQTGEKDLPQEEEITAEETKDSQPPKKSEGKYENELKGKKGKENRVKDGGKEKGKYKKTKDEVGKSERADKKSKDTAPNENPKSESSSGERKEKKGKKESKGSKEKKEKGVESAEGKKGRKKRDLLGFNEAPEDIAAPAPASEPRPPAPAPTPTGAGATAEERHVIACMRSPAMQPLVEQKTRAYQRLQAVLQRTAARQQDAPACVTDHVRKAELKVAAIQQRMASCADRKMREEL